MVKISFLTIPKVPKVNFIPRFPKMKISFLAFQKVKNSFTALIESKREMFVASLERSFGFSTCKATKKVAHPT